MKTQTQKLETIAKYLFTNGFISAEKYQIKMSKLGL